MVGATKTFIRRPFIWQNIKLGMLGALLALMGIGGVIYYVNTQFQDLGLLEEPYIIAVLLISIFMLGILISLISTYFATQRFLNLRTDELYY